MGTGTMQDSTHLREHSKVRILSHRSHERRRELDSRVPRIPSKLIIAAARNNSDGEVDQSSTRLRSFSCNLESSEDTIQRASPQGPPKVKQRPIGGRPFARVSVGAGADTYIATRNHVDSIDGEIDIRVNGRTSGLGLGHPLGNEPLG